jgi:AbrB family looped-hinge helix DNA binding protein
MAEITKVSTKGQVVIPQEVRDALGIKPGDTLQVERVGDLLVIKRVELKDLGQELRNAAKASVTKPVVKGARR